MTTPPARPAGRLGRLPLIGRVAANPALRNADFRRLWIVRLNAAVRAHDLNYSQFIQGLKLAGIELDRKALSNLAIEEPETFGKIVHQVKAKLAA